MDKKCKKLFLLNARGFSLVELMVVVGVIAILSAIAIPSYKGYQARARQKEGINLLSTYYSAAQSARVEFSRFPGNFVETGFAPVGRLGYRLQAADVAGNVLTWADAACTNTNAACTCGGACPNFKTWLEAPVVGGIGPAAVTAAACAPLAGLGVTQNTFSIRVAGTISLGAGTDQYGMDETKRLVMCEDGIN